MAELKVEMDFDTSNFTKSYKLALELVILIHKTHNRIKTENNA